MIETVLSDVFVIDIIAGVCCFLTVADLIAARCAKSAENLDATADQADTSAHQAYFYSNTHSEIRTLVDT